MTAVDAYAEHEETVRGVAGRFASRFRRDPEETLGRANLLFVEAVRKHDPARSPFTAGYLGWYVWKELVADLRKELRRHRLARRRRLRADLLATHDPRAFEIPRMGRDARELVDLVLNDPDLAERLRHIPLPRGRAVRATVRAFLAERGWTKRRYLRAALEIRLAFWSFTR